MIKVNLGCGWSDFGKDWHHVDAGDYEHLDSSDIFNLPFKDTSIDLIYASHIIEYFNEEEILLIIQKWKDKLKPGGILRLAVPNFYRIAELYINDGYEIKDFLGPLYGKMSMGKEVIYHKMSYDYNSLTAMLYKCKFNEVREWDWRETSHSHHDDHSQAYLPHMDKEAGILISLNIESVK